MYDAANRLEFLNGQPVYTFDANGNLLESDVLTNTFDAANRLVETSRSSTTLEPIYNGVNDRVGQVTDGVTTTFALDIAGGLPEVIYTSEGNAYLHLPGVVVAENNMGLDSGKNSNYVKLSKNQTKSTIFSVIFAKIYIS